VPAVKTHGGVRLEDAGEIRREGILNLAALRALAGSSDEETLQIRRYVLGLALVSITAPLDPNLREGCELVPDPNKQATWKRVKHDGTRCDEAMSHEDALEFATAAATTFQVPTQPTRGTFRPDIANTVLGLSEADRKKLLRQGPVTAEAIQELASKSKDGDGFEAAIKKMKKPDLEAECEKMGLSKDGKVADLRKRLLEAHAAGAQQAEPESDDEGAGGDEEGREQG
jgi:hypothetical protein